MTKSPHFGCAEKIKALSASMPSSNRRTNSTPGWTETDLASKSGLSYHCIYLIGRYERIPDVETIYKLADAFSHGRKIERDAIIAELVDLARQDQKLRDSGNWPPNQAEAAG